MSISNNGRIRVNVTGARGGLGIDLLGEPTPGEFLVKAPGGGRTFSTASGTGADSALRTDLAANTGASLIGTASGSNVQFEIEGAARLTNAVESPVNAVALANGGGGSLSGTYSYRISYVTSAGETEVSGQSPEITVSGSRIDLSSLPVSEDQRVIGRKIYRTKGSGEDPVLVRLVASINDNTTTTFSDNIPDNALGADGPYFNTTGGYISINGTTVASIADISTRFGKRANPNNSGYANSAFGTNSLKVNTNGYRNTAIGVDALENNTTGYEMTGVGVHALGANTTGVQSTAFGFGCLENSNANYNAAFGTKSSSMTTTGDSNTSFGTFSLLQNTTGSGNVAIGREALFTSNGTGNIAIGFFAGRNITTGNFNCLNGYQSGVAITTGSGNMAIGLFSLSSATTAADNVAIGGNSGKSLTTGTANVFIGSNAGNSPSQKVDAFESLAIGPSSFTTRDREIVIGKSSTDYIVIAGVSFTKANIQKLLELASAP